MMDRLRIKAFTLIELLVVIAIIALLMAIVMPGLNMAKKKAASVACLSNVRQMSMAWYMYQEDNDGEIMGGAMEDCGTDKECRLGWLGKPHTATDTTSSSLSISQTSPEVTDEDEIRGIRKGKLYAYLEDPDVYHCPADKLRKGKDGTKLFVSYAIARCLNGWDPGNSDAPQIMKFTRITNPSGRYNFVESGETTRGNWIMGGLFPMAAPEYGYAEFRLWAPVAINHGNSNVFGFTDGHAEVHKWHDSTIFDHYKRTETGDAYNQSNDTEKTSEDIAWLAKGWAYRHKQ